MACFRPQWPNLKLTVASGIPQFWIPRERDRNLPAVRQRHYELISGEGNRDRPDIADINFQSAHATCLRGHRDAISGGG